MKRRTGRTWLWFTLSAVLVLGALAWTTSETLRLERQELDALDTAGVEASFRNALGRLQAVLGPLFAPEEARPYLHYRAYYTPPRVYDNSDRNRRAIPRGKVQLASPLADSTPRFIRIHFEITDAGVHSPQVPWEPDGESKQRHEDEKVQAEAAELPRGNPEALTWLRRVRALTSDLTSVPFQNDFDVQIGQTAVNPNANNYQSRSQWQQVDEQQALSRNEYLARGNIANQVQSFINSATNDLNRALPDNAVEQGTLTATWIEDGGRYELFFVRTVSAERKSRLQGIWIDWPALETWLLAQIADIFPDARLVPAFSPATGKDGLPTDAAGRRVSGIPVDLETGPLKFEPRPLVTPTRIGLGVTWIAVLGALMSVAFVLRASVDLGERRGRFVTAVTHELRTPLTTFQMYAQMLADGMVPGESARQEYLETLKGESSRLARVVESVLLYSRLEQGRRGTRTERILVSDLLDRVLAPLSRRAADGGLELVIETTLRDGAAVDVDAQAVEQILLNLTDNACKYANEAIDRRLHVDAATRGARLEISLRDHGPGIPADVRGTLFEAYRRAKRHESGPVSGVGLGLALARGLARTLGGDVSLVDHEGDGAAFLVVLPLE